MGAKATAPSLRVGLMLLITQSPGWRVFCHLHPCHLSPPSGPRRLCSPASGSDGLAWDCQGCRSRCHRHLAHDRPKRHSSVTSGPQRPLCSPSPRSKAPEPRDGRGGGARRARPRATPYRLRHHDRSESDSLSSDRRPQWRAAGAGARVTFHGHGFQDAELLEHGDEQQYHHGHGAQLHALDAHGGPRAASKAPGRCSPPSPGEAAAHMPPAGGAAGVGGAAAPRSAAAASWVLPGGGTWHCGRAQLSESACKLRGAAAARARGASMPSAGAAPLSPALQPRRLSEAGVPSPPGRPASITAPGALIGLGSATTQEASPAPPPRPQSPNGRRKAAAPGAVQSWTKPGTPPPLPGQPGRPCGRWFHQTACAGWEPGRRGVRHRSLRSRGSPLLAKGA